MNCYYPLALGWFFMRIPQIPERRPLQRSKTFEFLANEYDSGFYICIGSKGDKKMYISKLFFEVVSKLVLDSVYTLVWIKNLGKCSIV